MQNIQYLVVGHVGLLDVTCLYRNVRTAGMARAVTAYGIWDLTDNSPPPSQLHTICAVWLHGNWRAKTMRP